jgi:hypothetical protein
LLLVKGTIWQVGAMLEKRDCLPAGMVALQAVARAWVIDAQATA